MTPHKPAPEHATKILTAVTAAPGKQLTKADICAATGLTHGQFVQGNAWIRDNSQYLAKHAIAWHVIYQPGLGWTYRITDLTDKLVIEHQIQRAHETVVRAQRNDIGALSGLEVAALNRGDLGMVRTIVGFRNDWERTMDAARKLEEKLLAYLAGPTGP